MAGTAELPSEMIGEILHRLPAKDLLRCRCVNKLWRSVIDDRSFVKKHLQHMTGSAGAENHRITILLYSDLQKLYSAEMEPPYRVRELPRPPMRVKLVGSCNGLLCLASSFSLDFLLWNPLTNSRARLPLPESLRRESVTVGGRIRTIFSWANDTVFGFGYDSVKEDYKVVIIDHVIREGYQDIRIYSSRRNSWRRFREERYKIHCLLSEGRMGVYACNNLHWVMTRRSDSNETRLIVAFDLRINNCREVPLPFYLGSQLLIRLIYYTISCLPSLMWLLCFSHRSLTCSDLDYRQGFLGGRGCARRMPRDGGELSPTDCIWCLDYEGVWVEGVVGEAVVHPVAQVCRIWPRLLPAPFKLRRPTSGGRFGREVPLVRCEKPKLQVFQIRPCTQRVLRCRT
ncbi:hypothetical protein CDL15_Pgr029016 [Punica granatum]|uniref:F-box domain-containing protein n=1 Tax=Punica granatum TaxID=22663 RepID=A0A218XKV3_PUNGR|nr:hypothetical protein CDL15_Pgr029016 [Punica granatum]